VEVIENALVAGALFLRVWNSLIMKGLEARSIRRGDCARRESGEVMAKK
jgi:hypothetical protein